MGLFALAAVKILSSAAVLLFSTVLLMATAKRISTCVYLFACQSFILTLEVIAAGYIQHVPEVYIIAAIVLLAKVIGIPYALLWLMKRLHTPHDVGASITPGYSVFVMSGLIVLSFAAVRLYLQELHATEVILAAAVALILSGAFLMVTRSKALMLVLGLLVLENGIFLAALVTTFGMPLIIEIGVVFDLLMGLLLMGIFVFRIRDTFDHLDVSRLRRLRG
ncbi:MAG TPA: hydrogenase [Candidatus Angelobacter sp.]